MLAIAKSTLLYATEIVAGAADHVRPLTSTLTVSRGVAW